MEQCNQCSGHEGELHTSCWRSRPLSSSLKHQLLYWVCPLILLETRHFPNRWNSGIQTPRSDRAAPELRMIPQGGMMMFDHNTSTLTNESYGPPGNRMAYWHGSLNHLSIGQGKGFLISLMGEMAFTGVPREDLPFTSDKHGDPVSFILRRAPPSF